MNKLNIGDFWINFYTNKQSVNEAFEELRNACKSVGVKIMSFEPQGNLRNEKNEIIDEYNYLNDPSWANRDN